MKKKERKRQREYKPVYTCRQSRPSRKRRQWDRDRERKGSWWRNGSGRVGRAKRRRTWVGRWEPGKGVTFKSPVSFHCPTVVSHHNPRHRLWLGQKQIDTNQKNKIFGGTVEMKSWMRRKWLNGWKTLREHEPTCEVATCGRGQSMLLIRSQAGGKILNFWFLNMGNMFGNVLIIFVSRRAMHWCHEAVKVLTRWQGLASATQLQKGGEPKYCSTYYIASAFTKYCSLGRCWCKKEP